MKGPFSSLVSIFLVLSFLGCQSEEKRRLSQVEEALDAGRYRDAIRLSDTLTHVYPKQSRELRTKAEIELRRRDGPSTLRQAEEALAAQQYNEAIRLAEELQSLGAFPKKAAAVRSEAMRRGIIKNSPNLLHEARQLLTDNQYKNAILKAQLIPREAQEFAKAQQVIRNATARHETEKRRAENRRKAEERKAAVRQQKEQTNRRMKYATYLEGEFLLHNI